MTTEHQTPMRHGCVDQAADSRQPVMKQGGLSANRCGIPLACVLIMVVAFGVLTPGCKKDDAPQRRMAESSGEFTKGYEDGRRDARNSWTDLHAGWMWLWMTGEQYRNGYDRGWSDGRSEKKLQDKQKKQDAQQSESKGLFASDNEG